MAEQDFEILDERFKECIRTSARLDRLFDGCRWAEGPAYSPAGRYLLCNKALADFNGRPIEQILGCDDLALYLSLIHI